MLQKLWAAEIFGFSTVFYSLFANICRFATLQSWEDCGYAVSKSLPSGRSKLIDIEDFDFNKYGDDSPKGFILEVNNKYPIELRDLNDDYSAALIKNRN